MTGNTVLLDANAVLRWILNDIPEQAARVRAVLMEADCRIPLVVLAEIVYVLEGYYGLERNAIAKTVHDLLALDGELIQDAEEIRKAVDLFATTRLDFVDCVLAGYSNVRGCEVCTFDQALRKQLGKAAY
jgi:predicted nucleic-acid-binding protein